jgi:LmbE family N-acetylglucosaminyl deacetylase
LEIRNKNILVICAHLDDETYGMGGTLIKLANPLLNNKIEVITFCSGLDGQDEKRIIKYYENLDRIGINGVIIGYDDVTLESISTLNLSENLSETIETQMPEPDIIFTHTPNDIHNDHQIVSELVDVWARNKNVSIFHFVIPGNDNWASKSIRPDIFMDISCFGDSKKFLIENYDEYPENHPLNHKSIKYRDRFNGSLVGVKSAEIFEAKRICFE